MRVRGRGGLCNFLIIIASEDDVNGVIISNTVREAEQHICKKTDTYVLYL